MNVKLEILHSSNKNAFNRVTYQYLEKWSGKVLREEIEIMKILVTNDDVLQISKTEDVNYQPTYLMLFSAHQVLYVLHLFLLQSIFSY